MNRAKNKFTVIRVSQQVFNMTRRVTRMEGDDENSDTCTIPFVSMCGAEEWCLRDVEYHRKREGVKWSSEHDGFGNFRLMAKNEKRGFCVEYLVEPQFIRINGKWNDPTIPVRYSRGIL